MRESRADCRRVKSGRTDGHHRANGSEGTGERADAAFRIRGTQRKADGAGTGDGAGEHARGSVQREAGRQRARSHSIGIGGIATTGSHRLGIGGADRGSRQCGGRKRNAAAGDCEEIIFHFSRTARPRGTGIADCGQTETHAHIAHRRSRWHIESVGLADIAGAIGHRDVVDDLLTGISHDTVVVEVDPAIQERWRSGGVGHLDGDAVAGRALHYAGWERDTIFVIQPGEIVCGGRRIERRRDVIVDERPHLQRAAVHSVARHRKAGVVAEVVEHLGELIAHGTAGDGVGRDAGVHGGGNARGFVQRVERGVGLGVECAVTVRGKTENIADGRARRGFDLPHQLGGSASRRHLVKVEGGEAAARHGVVQFIADPCQVTGAVESLTIRSGGRRAELECHRRGGTRAQRGQIEGVDVAIINAADVGCPAGVKHQAVEAVAAETADPRHRPGRRVDGVNVGEVDAVERSRGRPCQVSEVVGAGVIGRTDDRLGSR